MSDETVHPEFVATCSLVAPTPRGDQLIMMSGAQSHPDSVAHLDWHGERADRLGGEGCGMAQSITIIIHINGDATQPQTKRNRIIAHVCNDLGGWGKGFVLAISKRWGEPEATYRAWHKGRSKNDFGLGAVQLVQT